MCWLQGDNAQLRRLQTALLEELLSLRTELAAMSHRSAIPVAGPSAALVSVAKRAHELASGSASGTSNGRPITQSLEVTKASTCWAAEKAALLLSMV